MCEFLVISSETDLNLENVQSANVEENDWENRHQKLPENITIKNFQINYVVIV